METLRGWAPWDRSLGAGNGGPLRRTLTVAAEENAKR
jgi:hypothetical protein